MYTQCALLIGPFSSVIPQQDSASLEQGVGGLLSEEEGPEHRREETRGWGGGCVPGVWTSFARGFSRCDQSWHFMERHVVQRRTGLGRR